MKNKKYILLASLSSILLLGTIWVNAGEDSSSWVTSESNSQETIEVKPELRDRKPELRNLKETRIEFKNNKKIIQEDRLKLMEDQKERKMQMKDNLLNLKEETGWVRENFKELSLENKDTLKALRDEHKIETDAIKEKLKNTNLTLEERETLRLDLKNLNDELLLKIKEIVGDNSKALSFVNQREELRMQNQELREENKTDRIKFREERKEMVEKYKEKYYNTLAKAIPVIKVEKLEKISERINKLHESIEANTRISTERKEKLLSQILSLKEIMEEELDARNQTEENLNLDELFQ